MKRLNIFVLFFLLVTTSKAADITCHWPTNQILDSIVPIESGENSHASGVVVSNNLVITAAHVLEDYYNTAVSINDDMYLASVLLVDKETDIALFSVQTDNNAISVSLSTNNTEAKYISSFIETAVL